MGTPREDGFAMPPEYAEHERTLMAWPCRRELWGATLQEARREYAGVANAIAAFEPVTMVVQEADEAEARAALTGAVEIVALPIDDSWLRDNGPNFLLDAGGNRAAAVFGFNAWGEKFHPYDRDAALARTLCERLGAPVYDGGMILEGGSIALDGAGALVTTEQCLLNPNRNPGLDRAAIEQRLVDFLGIDEVVWLEHGLLEDRDTDGHVDLIAACTGPRAVLTQGAPEGDPDHELLAEAADRLRGRGFTVRTVPWLPRTTVDGEDVVVSYLNLYVCNGGVVVPVCGSDSDDDALRVIGEAFAGREVVGVDGAVVAYGGGGPHCITQQVPAAHAG